MKKYEIYVFVLFSFIIINYVAVAEWQKDGNLEWLNISNSAIKQYVFSQDGKSIYVLDSSNVFFKYDIETGKMLWIKNLASAKYADYTFNNARISEDADYYLVWFVKDIYTLRVQLRDLEKDNIINSFTLIKVLPKHYIAAPIGSSYNFIATSKHIIYTERFDNYYQFNGAAVELTGTFRCYQIKKDSIVLKRLLQNKRPIAYDYNKQLGLFIESYNYSYSGISVEGTNQHPFDYSDRGTYIYNTKVDSLMNLTPLTYSLLMLSNDGQYCFTMQTNTLSSYTLDNFRRLNSIIYPTGISSRICSYDDKFLLFGSLNELRIHNLVQLDAIDTIKFPNLNDYIYQIQYSPDNKGIYFSSATNIYRYNLDIQDNYVNAFFYPDTTIIEVNEPIHFYDASTKNAKTFLWDFGDGTTSTEQNPTHKYADTGYYDIRLIVADGENQDTFLIEKCVYILPELRADFDYKIYQSTFPVKVEFINKSLGKIDSVEWDFGDYSKSKENNPSHYYRYNDTFNVNLKIYWRFLRREITKQVIIKTTQPAFNREEWKYEAMYKNTSDMAAVNGIELYGERIVFVQERDNTPYSINNTGDLLWHKVWDSTSRFKNLGKRSLLQRYPANNNYFLFGQDSTLALMDYMGSNIYVYSIPDDTLGIKPHYLILSRSLNSITLNNQNIILGTYSSWQYSNIFAWLLELSPSISLLNTEKLIEVSIPWQHSIIYSGTAILSVFKNSKHIDYILRRRAVGEVFFGSPTGPPTGHCNWQGILLIINDTTIYNSYLAINYVGSHPNFKSENAYLYNSFIRLNDNTLIIAFKDTTVQFFNNQNKITKDLKYPNMYFTSMITLDSANFLAVGSINDSPGYAIINEMGQVVKTVILPGRFGAFNSIAITPDSNLLFSGYQYVDKELHRRPYFAKTNSQFIRERISQQMHVTSVDESQYDGNIAIYPNPVTDELQINGINGYQIWNYSISNLLGEEIMKGDLTSNVISLSNLPKGMYFITLQNQGKIIPFKFMKN